MRPNLRGISDVCLGLLVAAAPVSAHHSFAAEFDQSKPATLKGIVTKVEWMNPHIYVYLDIKEEKTGKSVNWSFEGGPPNTLYRQGWRKDSLKPGDTLSIDGFLAKDGSNLASMRVVTMPDGRKLSGGTPGEVGPATTGRGGPER